MAAVFADAVAVDEAVVHGYASGTARPWSRVYEVVCYSWQQYVGMKPGLTGRCGTGLDNEDA